MSNVPLTGFTLLPLPVPPSAFPGSAIPSQVPIITVCEPLDIPTMELARTVLSMLPTELQASYRSSRGRTSPVELLAKDLRKSQAEGGLRIPGRSTGDVVSRSEADAFMIGYHTSQGGRPNVPHTKLAVALMRHIPTGLTRPVLETIFFPEAPLSGDARRAALGVRELPVDVLTVKDGDTFRIIVHRPCGHDEVQSIRFAGIDTPEKFRSREKFWPQVRAILGKWMDEGLLGREETAAGDPVETLLANRLEYVGALSSLAMTDFVSWAAVAGAQFSVRETYNRVLRKGESAELCDRVAMYDKYGRGIWAVCVRPDNLIGRYLDERLAAAMQGGGRIWDEHQLDRLADAGAAKEKLCELRRKGRNDLAGIMDPSMAPLPSDLFSGEKVSKSAGIYRAFTAGHPELAADLSLGIVTAGLAYAYAKYRNDATGAYLDVGMQAQMAGLGLWGDATVVILNPNENVIIKNGHGGGRFEPFTIPPDCKENCPV